LIFVIAVILLVSSCKTFYKAISLPFCGNMYSSRIAGLCRLFHEYRGFQFFFFLFRAHWCENPTRGFKAFLKDRRGKLYANCVQSRKAFISAESIPCICLFNVSVVGEYLSGKPWTINPGVSPASFRRIKRRGTVMIEEWKCKQLYLTARKWMNLNTKWAVNYKTSPTRPIQNWRFIPVSKILTTIIMLMSLYE